MIRLKKSQISFFEFVLVFLLFGFIFTSSIYNTYFVEKDNTNSIDSFLDSFYYSENFRNLTFDEDLSQSTLTQNWDSVALVLDNSFLNYELILSNNTISKKIYSCNAQYNKHYAQRILSIKNNTRYEFRTITLGVCY